MSDLEKNGFEILQNFVPSEIDVVLMRPHILHASSKCVSPKHRRIVHIEYSNYQLSYGLEWM